MMMDPNSVQALRMALFREEATNVFAILDGASAPDLTGRLASSNAQHVCLFPGQLAPDLAQAAPYLALLEREASFSDWLLASGWGKHWGIFATSGAGLQALRNHLRKLLTVYDERGNSLHFRFYDPRVLRVCLPLCSSEELKTIFGPVTSYLAEDEVENASKFYHVDNVLRVEKVPVRTRAFNAEVSGSKRG